MRAWWSALLAAAISFTLGVAGPADASVAGKQPDPAEAVSVLSVSSAPLFGLLSEATTAADGMVSDRLFATDDFVHYRPLLAPAPPSENGVIGAFESASFPTQSEGWLVEGNADVSSGYLFETTDGGQTWQLVQDLWGGSGGNGAVFFLGPDDGWLAAGNIADDTYTLSRTTDGGQTWERLLAEGAFLSDLGLALPVFVNPERGFGVDTSVGFTRAPNPRVAKRVVESSLRATSDGGAQWSAVTVPVVTSGAALYVLPTFSGADGVLPVLVKRNGAYEPGPVTVDFDATSNAGRTWASRSTVATTAVASVGSPGAAIGMLALVDAPSVATASPADWWVLSVAPSGRPTVYRTGDAGKHWVVLRGDGLPTVPLAADLRGGVPNPVKLVAVTSRIAFASLYTSAGSPPATYLTTDGGSHWGRVVPSRRG